MVGAALKGIWSVGSGIVKTHTGRIAGGAAIGAMLAPEGTSDTTSFLSALSGATIGAGIGAIPLAAKGVWKGVSMKRAGRGLLNVGRTAGSMALGTGRLAARHPSAALVAGGVGLGLAYLASTGPGASSLSADQRDQQAVAMGATSYVSQVNRSFHGSTEGLVQGLHQGRHK
jgi:hypothetical protein